jgi:hypothetical protein
MAVVSRLIDKMKRIRLLSSVLGSWIQHTSVDQRSRQNDLLQQTTIDMAHRVNEAEETKAQLEADLLNRSERANELADENEILEDQLCHLEGLEGQLSNLQTQLSNDFGADGEAKPDSWCVAPHDLQCQGLYSCTYVPLGRLLAVGICDELIAFNTSNVAILGSDFHHRPAVMTQIEAFILGHWAIFRSAKMQTDGVDDPALLLCRALLIQLKVRIPLRSVGFPAFCTIITTPGVECVTL